MTNYDVRDSNTEERAKNNFGSSHLLIFYLNSSHFGKKKTHLDIHVFLEPSRKSSASGNGYKRFEWNPTIDFDEQLNGHSPADILSLIQFMEALDSEINSMREQGIKNLVVCAMQGRYGLTNVALMLGTYMILRLKYAVHEVSSIFDGLRMKNYITDSASSVNISLQDCLQSIEHSKALGWFKLPSYHAPYRWGMIDRDAYHHYDNPLNADLHEVVPGKIVLFRGPKDLGGADFQDKRVSDSFICRDFSPAYYAGFFADLGVSTVVRLNSPHYDPRAFTDRGIDHIDLDFGGQPTPSPVAVSAFFKIMDGARGAVAVHGREGVGRAATLAALYLMRSHRFKAREAMAWLRIMRPGSVLGEQERYLVDVEHYIQAAVARPPSAPSAPRLPPGRLVGCAAERLHGRRRALFSGPACSSIGSLRPAGSSVGAAIGAGRLELPDG